MTQTLRKYLEEKLGIKATDAEETQISETTSQMSKIESEAGNHLGAKHLGYLTLILGAEEQKRKTLEVFEIQIDKKYAIADLVAEYMRKQEYDSFETIAGELSQNCRWDEYFNDKLDRRRVEFIRHFNMLKADTLKIQLFEMEKE